MQLISVLSTSILILSIVQVRSRTSLESEQAALKGLFQNYNSRQRPSGKNGTGPVVVEVNMFIRSISNIDETKGTYDTQLTFRQSWKDERLRYNGNGQKYLSLRNLESIWTPDLFFSNEISGHFHDVIAPNMLIRIYPDGTVLYSTRISLHLFCHMKLRQYPLDTQTCRIAAASYGYTMEEVEILWKKSDPIQVTKQLDLRKYTFSKFTADYCLSKTNTGEYSCISVFLELERIFFHYLILAYFPTTTLVLLSWLVFWLNNRSSTLRLGLLIGIMVSNVIVMTSINNKSPTAPCATALDVWMGICFTFVLCALIEQCFVNNVVSSEDTSLKLTKHIANGELLEISKDGEDKKIYSLPSYSSLPMRWLNRYSTRAERIDGIARCLFPAAFLLFNFIYWITYSAM